VGCLSCYWACPYEARYVVEDEVEVPLVRVGVDGVEYLVPKGVTVAEALKYIGFRFGKPDLEVSPLLVVLVVVGLVWF